MGEPMAKMVEQVSFFAPCARCAPRAADGPCVVGVTEVDWLTCSVCGSERARHVMLAVTPAAAGVGEEGGRHG